MYAVVLAVLASALLAWAVARLLLAGAPPPAPASNAAAAFLLAAARRGRKHRLADPRDEVATVFIGRSDAEGPNGGGDSDADADGGDSATEVVVRRPRSARTMLQHAFDALVAWLPFLRSAWGTRPPQTPHEAKGTPTISLELRPCGHDSASCAALRLLLADAVPRYIAAQLDAGTGTGELLARLASTVRCLAYLHYATPSLPLHNFEYFKQPQPGGPPPTAFLDDLAEVGSAVPAQLVEASFQLPPAYDPSAPVLVLGRVRSRALRTQRQARKIAGDLVGTLRARAGEILRLPGTPDPDAAPRPDLDPSHSPPTTSPPLSPDSPDPFLLSPPARRASSMSSAQSDTPSDISDADPSLPLRRPRSRSPPNPSGNHLGLSAPTMVAVLTTFTSILARREGAPIPAAMEDQTLQLASGVAKRAPRGPDADPARRELEERVRAGKLGVPPGVLRANPSFAEFAANNHLWRYLYIYRHRLRVGPPPELEVSVLLYGEWTPWPLAEPKIEVAPGRGGVMQMKGRYSDKGIINSGFYDWRDLAAFTRVRAPPPPSPRTTTQVSPSPFVSLTRTPTFPDDADHPPPWGRRHVLDVCALLHPLGPRINGDHAWLRLKDPQGGIVSVGLYRPEGRGYWEWLRYPLKRRQGAVQSPDVSEFWGGENVARCLSIGIDAGDAEKVRRKIVRDRERGTVAYQVTSSNCVAYVCGYAELCGVHLPYEMPLSEVMAFNGRTWEKWWADKVSWVLRVLSGNLGGGLAEDGVGGGDAGAGKRAVERVGTDGIVAAHPWVVGEVVRREVEAWREGRKAPLRERVGELERRLGVLETDVGVEWAGEAAADAGTAGGEGAGDGAEVAPARSVRLLREEIRALREEMEAIDYDIPEKYRGPKVDPEEEGDGEAAGGAR